MKSTAFAFAFVLSAAAASSWAAPARAATCTNDIDCTDNGTACGTDVCSWASTPHECVPAASGDPGWCTQDSDCKCAGAGAKCLIDVCSFTRLDGGEAEDASSSSAASSASSSSAAEDGGSSQDSGGSGGGCTIGVAASGASWPLSGMGLACLLGLRRRRRV